MGESRFIHSNEAENFYLGTKGNVYLKSEKRYKPAIGVMPRKLWEEQRVNDITQAISRRMRSEGEIPIEWVEEYNELSEKRSRL